MNTVVDMIKIGALKDVSLGNGFYLTAETLEEFIATEKILTAGHAKYVKNGYIQENAPQEFKDAVKVWERYLNSEKAFDIMYAFVNVKEFAAMTIESNDFQSLLNSIPYDSNKSLFDKFIDLLADFFDQFTLVNGEKVADKSALKASLEYTIALMGPDSQMFGSPFHDKPPTNIPAVPILPTAPETSDETSDEIKIGDAHPISNIYTETTGNLLWIERVGEGKYVAKGYSQTLLPDGDVEETSIEIGSYSSFQDAQNGILTWADNAIAAMAPTIKGEKVPPVVNNPIKKSQFSYKGKVVKTPFPLTHEQTTALENLIDFISGDMNPKNTDTFVRTLEGYAGTGKTSIVGIMYEYFGGSAQFAFAAPTHAASLQLGFNTIKYGDRTMPFTFQSSYKRDWKSGAIGYSGKVGKKLSGFGPMVMIIDEASMLDDADVKKAVEAAQNTGTKIIFMGDPKQIPAPKGGVTAGNRVRKALSPAFTKFKKERLTEIKRTDDDTLLNFQTTIRENMDMVEYIPETSDGIENYNLQDWNKAILAQLQKDPEDMSILAYTNAGVAQYNDMARTALGFSGALKVGETIIGYGGTKNKQIIAGDLANSIIYKVTSIKQDPAFPGSYVIIAESKKIKELQDSGMQGLDPVATFRYIPVSASQDKMSLDATVDQIAKNVNELLLPSYRNLHQEYVKLNANKKYYPRFLENTAAIMLTLNKINLTRDLIYNPSTDKMEILNKDLKSEQGRYHNQLKKNFPLTLMEKGIDFGYSMTVHKSQGASIPHVFVAGDDLAHNNTDLVVDGEKVNTENNAIYYVAVSRASDKLHYRAGNGAIPLPGFEPAPVQSPEPPSVSTEKPGAPAGIGMIDFSADPLGGGQGSSKVPITIKKGRGIAGTFATVEGAYQAQKLDNVEFELSATGNTTQETKDAIKHNNEILEKLKTASTEEAIKLGGDIIGLSQYWFTDFKGPARKMVEKAFADAQSTVKKKELPAYTVDKTLANSDGTKKLASTDGTTIKINPVATIEEFFDYFEGREGGLTSEQKALVLFEMNLNGWGLDKIKSVLNTKKKIHAFLVLHEQDHIDHGDKDVYWAQGRDLLTQDKIDIETRASINALKKVQKLYSQPTTQTNEVEVVSRYTNADVKANPNKIYVFGDNTQRKGTGGQAQIRNNENAFGIATKLQPNNSAAAFMSDNDLQSNKDVIDSDIAKIKADGRPVVFPKDGFGTGLAKLKEKAPQTYAYLKQRLQEEFGFNNDTGVVSKPAQKTSGAIALQETKTASQYKVGDIVTVKNIKYKLEKSKTTLSSILRQKYEAKFGEHDELNDDQFFAYVMNQAEDASDLSPMELQDTLNIQNIVDARGNVYNLIPLKPFDPDTNPQGGHPILDVVDNLLPDIVDKPTPTESSNNTPLSKDEEILAGMYDQMADFQEGTKEYEELLKKISAQQKKISTTKSKRPPPGIGMIDFNADPSDASRKNTPIRRVSDEQYIDVRHYIVTKYLQTNKLEWIKGRQFPKNKIFGNVQAHKLAREIQEAYPWMGVMVHTIENGKARLELYDNRPADTSKPGGQISMDFKADAKIESIPEVDPDTEKDKGISAVLNYQQSRLNSVNRALSRFRGTSKEAALLTRRDNIERIIETLKEKATLTEVRKQAQRELANVEFLLEQARTGEDDYKYIAEVLNDVLQSAVFWSEALSTLFNPLELKSSGKNEKGENIYSPSVDAMRNIVADANSYKEQVVELMRDHMANIVKETPGVSTMFSNLSAKDLEVFEDLDGFTANFLDSSRTGNPVLMTTDKWMRDAVNRTNDEANELYSHLETIVNKVKATSAYKNEGFKLFAQRDSEGNLTGNMATRFSQSYYDTLKNLRNAAKNKGTKAGWDNFFKWKKKNEVTIDFRKVYFEDYTTKDEGGTEISPFTEADREAHFAELKEQLGEAGFNKIMKGIEDKYSRYKALKRASDTHIDATTDDKVLAKLKKLKWEAKYSPFRYAEISVDGNTRVNMFGKGKTAEFVNPEGWRYTESVPRRIVDGNPTLFYDESFEAIENNEALEEFYYFFTDTVNNVMNYLPQSVTDKHQMNTIPELRKELLEKIFEEKNLKSGFVGIHDAVIQMLTADESSGIVKHEIDVNTDRALPSPSISMLDQAVSAEEKSYDLDKVLKAFISMAIGYKHKSRVEDQIRMASNVIKHAREIQSVPGAKTNKLKKSKFGRVLFGKDGLSKLAGAMDYAIESFYGQAKPVEGVMDTKLFTWEEKKKKRDADAEIQEITDKLENEEITQEEYDDLYTAIDEEYGYSDLGRNLTGSRIGDTIIKYVQLKGMGWNVFSAVTNMIYGGLSNVIHANGREDFSLLHLRKALAVMLHSTGTQATAGYASSQTADKVRNLMVKFDVLKEFNEEAHRTTENSNKNRKGLSKLAPYEVQRSSEYFVQGQAMVATMMATGLDGKKQTKEQVAAGEPNLWESYDTEGNLTKDVGAQPAWEGDPNKESDNIEKYKFKNKLTQIIKATHGNYDPESAVKIKKTVAGRFLMQFRSWVSEGWAGRFEEDKPDALMERRRKGRYRTLGELGFMNSITTLAKQAMYSKTAFETKMKNGEEMSEVDIANMRKNLAELTIYLSLAAMVLVLKQIELDDDDEELSKVNNLLLNQLFRLENDIQFYTNPMAFEAISRNAIPAFSLIMDTSKFVAGVFRYAQGEDIVKTGKNAGESNLAKKTGKMLPFTAQFYKIKTASEYLFE